MGVERAPMSTTENKKLVLGHPDGMAPMPGEVVDTEWPMKPMGDGISSGKFECPICGRLSSAVNPVEETEHGMVRCMRCLQLSHALDWKERPVAIMHVEYSPVRIDDYVRAGDEIRFWGEAEWKPAPTEMLGLRVPKLRKWEARRPKAGNIRMEKVNAGSPIRERREVPPPGWSCTRAAGHDGPCAAVTENGAMMCESRFTWIERLGMKLFPARHCDVPEPKGRVIGNGDCIVCRTGVVLGFWDRARILFSGRLTVETKTATENRVGENVTNGVCYVNAPAWMQPKP